MLNIQGEKSCFGFCEHCVYLRDGSELTYRVQLSWWMCWRKRLVEGFCFGTSGVCFSQWHTCGVILGWVWGHQILKTYLHTVVDSSFCRNPLCTWYPLMSFLLCLYGTLELVTQEWICYMCPTIVILEWKPEKSKMVLETVMKVSQCLRE